MSQQEAYERAAACYHQAGYHEDAARCYQLAGAHRRAAELYELLDDYGAAAGAYVDAGMAVLGAWLLAHRAGEPARARTLVGGLDAGTAPELRVRLIVARCELAEAASPQSVRLVVMDVCAALTDREVRADQYVEEWAVALAESAGRYDLAALVYAAAVKGSRYGAEHRWKLWSRRVLGTDVILPTAPIAAA